MPACFGFAVGTWVRPLGGDPIADIAPAPRAPTATTAASARRFVRVIRVPPFVDPRHARDRTEAACYDRVESLKRSGDATRRRSRAARRAAPRRPWRRRGGANCA